MPDPGGAERTKNSVRLLRDLIKVVPVISTPTTKPSDNRKNPMITRSRGVFLRSYAQDQQSYDTIKFEASASSSKAR